MDRYVIGKGEDIWLADNYAKIMKTITTQDLQTLLNNQSNKIDELQNQLKSQPKEIVEKIKDKIPEIGGMKCEIIINDFLTLNTLLDTILKEYQK